MKITQCRKFILNRYNSIPRETGLMESLHRIPADGGHCFLSVIRKYY